MEPLTKTVTFKDDTISEKEPSNKIEETVINEINFTNMGPFIGTPLIPVIVREPGIFNNYTSYWVNEDSLR